jgi:carbamoyltransferase
LNLYIIYHVFAYYFKIPGIIEKFLSERITGWKLDKLNIKAPVICVDHHYAHAASAYYTFPCGGKALVITADAMGDALSVTVNTGEAGNLNRIFSQTGFSGISTYYSRLTEFLGFKSLRHEGKITGLAGYGKFDNEILNSANRHLRFIEKRSSFNIKNHFFPERRGDILRKKLRGRSPEDIAHNFQKNFEDEITKFVRYWLKKTGIGNVCLSGGTFANVSLNKKISGIGEIDNLYVFPHMGDGGLALGAALSYLKPRPFYLKNIYLGPEYGDKDIKDALDNAGLDFTVMEESALCNKVASLIYEGGIVAHFNGRMEYGPRALGNRSIFYRADDPSCNDWLNDKLKRTEFMPFAPMNIDKEAEELYLNIKKIRYTLRFMNAAVECSEKMKRLCPAAVHVDGTARPQILSKEDNPRVYEIMELYRALKGTSAIINTSFNRHEEPIVRSPQDAVKSFIECELDYLVLNNFLVSLKGVLKNDAKKNNPC